VFGKDGGYSCRFSKYQNIGWRWVGQPMIIGGKKDVCDNCVTSLIRTGRIREDVAWYLKLRQLVLAVRDNKEEDVEGD
jgi:hypothetical protein